MSVEATLTARIQAEIVKVHNSVHKKWIDMRKFIYCVHI